MKTAATHTPTASYFRRLARWALVIVFVLTGITAVVTTETAARIKAGNQALSNYRRVPFMPLPVPPQRILVFSPHCDDETLGVGGYMREARLHKCDVRVVVLTNGDGFRAGTAEYFHELTVPAADYIQYASQRQKETCKALSILSVPGDHVTFLGYPDRGLMPLWKTSWSPFHLFTSRYTQTDHCPYQNAPHRNAPYCGAGLLQDIKQEMLADRPTDIFVTHPNDDHPDHAAASVFVRRALDELRATDVPWAQTAHLHYYLVHHGDWPLPQGLYETAPLAPPVPATNLTTQWEQFPLASYDTMRKYAAIKRYPSQTQMLGRFLYSFARRNELFGSLVCPIINKSLQKKAMERQKSKRLFTERNIGIHRAS